jgi:hypothetical protein
MIFVLIVPVQKVNLNLRHDDPSHESVRQRSTQSLRWHANSSTMDMAGNSQQLRQF